MNAEIEADFFNPPIRELPAHYVWDWYHGAYDPGGVPQATWSYLLPRILEMMAAGTEVSAVGPEVTLKRFPTGDRHKWSDAEWRVLDEFQRAFLYRKAMRGKSDTGNFLDDYICMFALGGWPVDDLIDQITALPDEVLVARLWHDWLGWGGATSPAQGDIWLTTFWEGAQKARIWAFYTSADLLKRMERVALSDDMPKDVARKASDLADIIERAAGTAPPD